MIARKSQHEAEKTRCRRFSIPCSHSCICRYAEFEMIVGVHRLGWDDRVSQLLDSDEMMYAVGQGALGIECRADDIATQELCAALDHLDTRLKCTAERSFMRELEGGCSVPLGVYTELLSEDGVDNVKLKLIGYFS